MSGQSPAVRRQDRTVKADLARLRICYRKDDRLAYLGHLDLIATMERCIRRAGLPFSLGNGFARRMRIQFSSALPTGTSSSCEYLDVRLTEQVDPNEALARLAAASPAALAPSAAGYVPGRLPSLEVWLNHAAWEVVLPACPLSPQDLLGCIEQVRQEGTLSYLRGDKEKHIDVAGSLAGVWASAGSSCVRLELETRAAEGAALRPQVLLSAAFSRAGLPLPEQLRVRRTSQCHEENGRLVEPLGPFAPADGVSVS